MSQAGTLADRRIVVAIDGWEADSLYPTGHYVRTLGAIGDRETETEVRLAPLSPHLPGWLAGWLPGCLLATGHP